MSSAARHSPSRAGVGRGFVAMLAVLATVMAVAMLPAATGDNIADHVLGQQDFLHKSPNTVDGVSLDAPSFVAVDRSGHHLYLSDTMNNRVLGWHDIAAFVTGQPADLVLGQPDFFSNLKNGNGGPNIGPLTYNAPAGVAVDSNGNLYVADSGNSRVLEYNAPYAACASLPCVGHAPNVVFGQTGDFFAGGCNLGAFTVAASADSLCGPIGVAVDSHDNLYIADSTNNRVVEFNTPLTVTAVPGSGDTTADFVYGQGSAGTDFTDPKCNGNAGIVGANVLCNPQAVAIDSSGNVFISDTNNSRVLEYNEASTPPANAAPNLVFGQSNFTGFACSAGTMTGLCFPIQLTLDSSNNLYVADTRANRVLEFNTPLTKTGVMGSGDTIPDLVLGEPDFTSVGNCLTGHPSSATSLCAPAGIDLDSAGDVFVADTQDNRVLIFDNLLGTDTTADVVLGQPDFAHYNPNSVDTEGLFNPGQMAIDQKSSPQHLYVADASNSRVLGWKDATSFVNGAPADLVLGQPDFSTGTSNTGVESMSSMAGPLGVAVDSKGNLYVVDTSNNRVLEFNTPFVACGNTFPCVGGPAAIVFGLTGTSTQSCVTPGPTTLCGPQGVALDPMDELFVADTRANRVLGYFTPLSSTTANIVFGQGTNTSFMTGDCNHPSSTVSASSLCLPKAVAADANGNIYISDTTNNRVLEYNESGPPSNITANVVFGQTGSATTTGCNQGGVSANSLCAPAQVAFDSAKNLYIADTSNSRVLEFNTPLTPTAVPGSGDATADRVFGQADNMTANACNFAGSPAASTLCAPLGVALDTSGDLLVVDAGNNRILKYDQPLAGTPTATATATSTASTPTATPTATHTATGTATSTSTSTSSRTPTPTTTATATSTHTPTPTATPTATASPSATATPFPPQVIPPALAFGTTTSVGKTSKPKTVTIKNTSKKNGPALTIQMESVSPGAFAIKSQCKKTLKPGKSCKVSVTFTPPDTTAQVGTLSIFDNAAGGSQTVTLSGMGK